MEALLQQFDGYCERTDFSYWSEPINALTNAAFLIAAYIMWQRLRGQGLGLATLLCGVLAAIGIGSYLFHTHATGWAGIADVLPIAAFVLIYIFAANRDYWQMRPLPAAVLTMAYVPVAATTVPFFSRMPFFNVSAAYWPIPVLIAVYAALLTHRTPETARGLSIGAGLLCLSLVFRSVDSALCASLPIGTHFLWHIVNAVMLGWMIEVYRRHMIRQRAG